MDWPLPASAKELRSFLGLAGYYRKFVRNFGVICRPLTNLLKKNTMFIWTSEHDTSFAALKSALSSAPVLALPDFTKTFCIETDASDTGVGAVLMQASHPLAFISKALRSKNRGLSTYEKEYMAILLAVEHWRSYLQLGEFQIYILIKRVLPTFLSRGLTLHGSKRFSLNFLAFNMLYCTRRALTTECRCTVKEATS